MNRYRRSGIELTWLQAHFGSELDADAVRAFITNLVSDRRTGRLVLEVESSRSGTVWRVGSSNPQALRRLIKTHLPDITVTGCERAITLPLLMWRLDARSTAMVVQASVVETASAGLLGALAVSGSARTVQQLVIGRRLMPERVPQRLFGLRGRSWAQQLLSAVMVGAEPVDREERRDVVAKRALPGAVVTVRLGVHDSQGRYGRLPAGYVAAWRAMAAPGARFRLRPERPKRLIYATAWPGSVRLNSDELVAVLAWPYGERSYPLVDRDRSVRLPVKGSTSSARPLGISTFPGQAERQLRLSVQDGLRHTVVTGPTGVGKSTLLATMALADIEAGRSVVVVDPKADLVDDLLARIPEQHLGRTVVLDPASTDRVVGFNPLLVRPSEIHQAVDGLVHVFKTLHASSWGPRTEDILHASLLTLAGSGGSSLIDIPALLTNPSFRHAILTGAATNRSLPAPLRAFWDWFDSMSSSERAHVCAPLLNKLRPFTLRPSLATTLSAAEPFRLDRVFTERLVLLVPLRKGRVGSEVAQLFGSLLVSELWRTIGTRASLSRQRRHPTFVYADEFQDYVALPTDFADVLAQSRGLGVGWTIAHQNFDQLPSQLQRAVAANAQNKIYFRLGADDAERVARRTDDLRATDLARLPAFEAYAQILHRNELMPFASIRTQPLPKPVRNPRAAAKALVRRWGQPIHTTSTKTQSDDNEPHSNRRGTTPDSGESSSSLGRRKRGQQ